MSKAKLNGLEAIKQKVLQSGGASAQAAMIDTNIIEDDRREILESIATDTTDTTDTTNIEAAEDVNEHVEEVEPRDDRRFEEIFSRATFWIRKELLESIEKSCSGAKGEKTRIINEALNEYFSKRMHE